jgi:hypothetical protein
MFPLEASRAKNFEVLDLPLTSDEIRVAAIRLKTGKAPGPNQFCQDTVREWAKAEMGTKSATYWEGLVRLCQKSFDTGEVPNVMKEGILVLIPKQGTKSFCGITLLDTVYKPIALVINVCTSNAIQFYTGVHRFQALCGCNTTIQDTKWDMQAQQESTQPYHQVSWI